MIKVTSNTGEVKIHYPLTLLTVIRDGWQQRIFVKDVQVGDLGRYREDGSDIILLLVVKKIEVL